jgi:hypothetical protein
MTEETKKHLIFGGALIVATIAGIILYKKFQVSSQANQAANDQATQDELDYLETMVGAGGAYASAGGVSDTITAPTAPALPSIGDELQQLEQAFGFAPLSGSSGTSSGTGSGTNSPVTAVGPAPVVRPPAVQSNALEYNPADTYASILSEEEPQLAEEGIRVA